MVREEVDATRQSVEAHVAIAHKRNNLSLSIRASETRESPSRNSLSYS